MSEPLSPAERAELDALRAMRDSILSVAMTALDNPMYHIDPSYLIDLLGAPPAPVEPEVQSVTVGWYEFVTADRRALTSIAYVHENGDVYMPEGNDPEEFLMAAASGRTRRLVRTGVDLS